MEDFIKEQIAAGIKTLPSTMIKSLFIKQYSEETQRVREKEFIFGICHPNRDVQLIKDANIGWIRIDIPFPFDKDGKESTSYHNFKEKCQYFKDAGVKIMAITPYHQDYTDSGIVLGTIEGEKRIKEIAVFMMNDLRNLVDGYQITNEMGIPRFTVPLTIKQAARFIGIQLKAMYPIRGDILIGYNAAGPQPDLQYYMKDYFKYCDYVGFDLYMGCFFTAPGFMFVFDLLIRYLWTYTRRPILLQEFGYISDGAPKTKEEKIAILKGYGFDSEKAAKNNIVQFVENMPEEMKNHVKRVCMNNENKYLDFTFKGDYKNHIYKELPKITKIPGYSHTPDGQAKFYFDIIERLYNKKCMIGMFLYCWQDSDKCYVCSQPDCPTETRWGLVNINGKPKPSYYAVQKALGKIINKK